MYVATPPECAGARPGTERTALGLARVEYQEFDGGGGFQPQDRIYFSDLMAAYGRTVRPGYFDGTRVTFRDMAEGMLPRLLPHHDRFDLALLASVTSDAEAGRPLCYLAHTLSHIGLAYGVADQGAGAAFTALRMAATGVRQDGARSVLLLLMDQAAVPHADPVPGRLAADRNAVVALVLGTEGDLASLTPHPAVRVAPDGAGERLRGTLASLRADGRPLTLIAGPGLTPHLPDHPADEVVTAPGGGPCTAAWSLLARGLPAWRAVGRRVVLADYDPDFSRLSMCTVDTARNGTGP
ncbi:MULTISPECIES: hypothetical protein [Streptomyces]|uniref:Beta-ketoacyl synthase N-terminal domain-containing protein n=1 Tax=Streptomyces canarius TaxID=285453 RepID=A0ABQ3D061_9ACTN|nr:hypothetical protein [Streptomyces canarius]GHA52206.1 hypothetical protein GCM10010345_65990 [Streptomyces canarius]